LPSHSTRYAFRLHSALSDTTSTVTVFVDADDLAFAVDRAEIGKPTAVNVLAESTAGGAHDLAPDLGTIHYKLTPLVLTISSFTAMRSARAERLELGVTRSDSGGPLLGEPPLCHGRVAGKVVFATVLDDARVGQRACCAWKFPKALVGKKARLTITIPYAGRKVSRSVSLTIR
jgi:hypothetical protein